MNSTKFYTALSLAAASEAIRLQWSMPGDCQEMVMMGTPDEMLPAHCHAPGSAAAAPPV